MARTVNTLVPRWMVTPCCVIQINWDATIDETLKVIGVCVIVRDHEEKVLEIMCLTNPYITDPIVAKAFAACKEVKFGRDLGIHNIILKGDALK